MKIVIAGGGPGGYTAALSAAAYGAETVLISDELGGTCLHRGCIPTKLFLQEKPCRTHARQVGAAFSAMEQQTAAGMQYRLKKSSVTLKQGRASLTPSGELLLGTEHIPYDRLILATGSVPRQPVLPGDNRYRFLDPLAFLHDPASLPDHVCILGAGAVGVELAVILHQMGIHVAVAEQQGEILPGADPGLAARLRTLLEEQGIAFHLGCDTPVYRDVIPCCGRVPVLPDGAQALLCRDGALVLDEHYRTLRPHIFAIGDCTGRSHEAAEASQQAHAVTDFLFGKTTPYRVTAHCIYTTPNLAWAGTARQGDRSVSVSFPELPAGQIAGESSSVLKLCYAPDTGEITAVHILSRQAALLIGTAQMLLQQHTTVRELSPMAFPHPTPLELFSEAAARAEKKI